LDDDIPAHFFKVLELCSLILAVLVPGTWFGFTLTSTLRETRDDVREIREKVDEIHALPAPHERIEDHSVLLKALLRSVDELTHYIRWLAETQTGRKPPPPLPLTRTGTDNDH